MQYLVIDLETQGDTTFKRFCNPLDERHYVVCGAYKYHDREATVLEFSDRRRTNVIPNLDNIDLIIGQNFKFDMLWFWENKNFQDFLKRGGLIWDTLTVQYLLDGQMNHKRDLDTLSLKYGGKLKDDRVTELYKAGHKTEDIPRDILIEYAKQDVLNTEVVALAQVKIAKKKGMLPLIRTYMEHYVAVTEMEANGMYMDKAKGMIETKDLEIKLQEAKDNIQKKLRLWPEEVEFNPGSNDQVSIYLFGGKVPAMVDTPVKDDEGNHVFYKSGIKKGQIKTRKEKTHCTVMKLVGLNTDEWIRDKEIDGQPLYKVDDEVLSEIINDGDKVRSVDEETKEFTRNVLQYRQLQKILKTYYYFEDCNAKGEVKRTSGLLAILHPDQCVHSEFKTSKTRTGRLASTNPNIQNLHPDVLHLFSSRFGADGVIVELDYGQLEVVIQAYLSQSQKMIKDIENGVDFHCKRLAYAENKDYNEVIELVSSSSEWKEKRRKAKIISFEKAYGAMPEKISKSTGLPVEQVKQVFDKEDEEYPEIRQFYDAVFQSVTMSRKPTSELAYIKNKATGKYDTQPGEYKAFGEYQEVTGKMYKFEERIVDGRRGLFRYFRTPDMQNYPVQGTAADLVALGVGKVFKYLQDKRDKALLINEVHDSLLLDVKKEHVLEITDKVHTILEDVGTAFEERFGIKFNVPIKVDVSVGTNWKECK